MADPTRKRALRGAPPPEATSEAAPRHLDPFETDFLGVIRSNDPLLIERGGDYRIYQDLLRDGKVFASLQKRTLALVQHDWIVSPLDDTAPGAEADAQKVSDALSAINFDQICQDLMGALLLGLSVSEIVWEVRDGAWLPARVLQRRIGRFAFVDPKDGRPPELRLLTREAMVTGVPLPPGKFIAHRVNAQDDNPYGQGLGLQLYWPVFFKRKGIVAWNKLVDRFGSPTPHGKHRPNATPKEKNTLFAALRAMSNDGVLMTPEDVTIELLESKLTGSMSTQRELLEYMDDWIAEVVLGTEPRAKGGGALAAASKERAEVRLGLTKADADLLSGTLNETLLRWLCEYNGWAPCKVYRDVQEEADTKAESETDKNIASMGFRLTLAAVQEKYGEGWEEAPAPPPAPPTGPAGTVDAAPGGPAALAPAQFAEAAPVSTRPGWEAIDRAVASISDARLQSAMDGLLQPLLDAIDGADDFAGALAAAQAAYPRMDSTRLEAMLAQAMFGAGFFAREQDPG